MALAAETLYVADTENHLIRKIDLARQQVTTVAGTGRQNRETPPYGSLSRPLATALSSPWDPIQMSAQAGSRTVDPPARQ